MKIWIWCAVDYVDDIKDCVIDRGKIGGIIDGAYEKQGKEMYGLKIFSPQKAGLLEQDKIIIAAMKRYNEIREEILNDVPISGENVLCFFDKDEDVRKIETEVDEIRWKNIRERIFMQNKLEQIERIISNLKYEMIDAINQNNVYYPFIQSGKVALYKIILEHKSLCRFGDGEFEMIANRERPVFQQPDSNLGRRLKEVLKSNHENVLIAIADNYGSLEKYTEQAADAIRKYITEEHRTEQMQLLDFNREYFDAYVSRPYIIYKNKKNAEDLFELWKKVWKNRDVLIVEGQYSRNGYRNDLMDSAAAIRRILVPNENAWQYYEEILDCVKYNADRETLILVSLGPTATVMAYDLAESGFQAIDIGQVDNEYEWYLSRAKRRENISYKYVSEVGKGRTAEDILDVSYEKQIIARIGC